MGRSLVLAWACYKCSHHLRSSVPRRTYCGLTRPWPRVLRLRLYQYGTGSMPIPLPSLPYPERRWRFWLRIVKTHNKPCRQEVSLVILFTPCSLYTWSRHTSMASSSEPDANFWCSPFLHACSEHACGVERHHHIASGRHSHQAAHAFGQTFDHHFFSRLSQRCILVLHDSCNLTSHCGFHDGFAPSGCRDCAQVVGVVASPHKRSVPCWQKHYNIVRPCEPVTIKFYNLSLLENGQTIPLHFTVAELEGRKGPRKVG